MIVDFHTHIHPPELRDRREHYVERDATFRELYADPKATLASVEDLLASMDEDGVDVSVVMGVGWTDPGLARESNDYVIDSVRRYPERLVGFASVNPVWGEEAAAELERCADAGLRGVGELHPDTQGFDLGDEDTMAPVMDVVRRRGLIVATHSSEPVGHMYQGKGATRPDVLWRFIVNHPDVTVVCAHWGGGLPFYALMPEVAEGLGNVYFDTAASPFLYTPGVFETVVRLVGEGKVLMGSDFPLMRAGRLLRGIEGSSLSREERIAVTGGSAAALLGLGNSRVG